ncbi:MAG: 50S ribosomal protein L22 [Candidatus Abawacabacteria bacterium RIFCSPHIGHO2_01_FULL_46_8]|uniref:Large ribosomal subunit protein uL22 n=1 Tax=Candidatus Abawacabacteria bacterium RIFCSPHIGHO2_01_FULL_46_8 TaxID=1817815 RepID=A0A1F4XMH8_9BACT|nr:ribosomal protein L22 [uncultured bacterium]OGC82935.1 MAG: 50S ribosomal protein L22 [Candidatus Abawacabacteria bacterium RIFCSPHIGHO2_01_FULL_46_8]
MKALLKNVRISPKKLSVIAKLVRGKPVDKALLMLEYAPKKGAKFLHKVIKSAAANAENNQKLEAKNLKVAELVVNKGFILKRGMPGTRGRWKRIWKRASNIWVTLTPQA